MQITEKLENSIGKEWCRLLKSFIESEEMDKLFSYIKQRAQVTRIAPKSDELWKAFQLCPPDKVKVIICGISPYHTFTDTGKKGIAIADGIALSCSHTWKTKGLQPSIEQVYDEWEGVYNDGVMDPEMIRDGDLSYLAEQGVLLYNIALTVEENKACSMSDAWAKFNEFFWTQVVGQYMSGVCCIFLGQQAHKSANYLNPMQHYLFSLPHPASASYKGVHWSSEGVFQKIDTILWENNKAKIKWYKRKSDIIEPEPEWVTNPIRKSTVSNNSCGLPWE